MTLNYNLKISVLVTELAHVWIKRISLSMAFTQDRYLLFTTFVIIENCDVKW